MGPPREHGGMKDGVVALKVANAASMGPPREHGGMFYFYGVEGAEDAASMGPPREHGGMPCNGLPHYFCPRWLQWGRRVNTAECGDCSQSYSLPSSRFNGAAA